MNLSDLVPHFVTYFVNFGIFADANEVIRFKYTLGSTSPGIEIFR